MKFKDWYQCKYKGKVILRILEENPVESAYRYTLTEEMIDKADLPIDARKCRGEPYYWSYNKIENKNDGHDPDGYTGSHACRFMHTDAFDNLLTGLWKEGDHFNPTKMLVMAGVVIAVVIGAWIVFGGRA